MIDRNKKTQQRKARIRYRIRQNSQGRLRLSVHRSEKNIYAQLVDDQNHITLCSASTLDPEIKGKLKGTKSDAAALVGQEIAKKIVSLGHKNVVFDRGAYIYHGRIKALAESARQNGLNF